MAREAQVSTDFLYRQPQLRHRIQQMRTTIGRQVSNPTGCDNTPPTASAPVRALSQLKELRRRHRDEITALQQELAVAQGENLALRRKLAAYE